MTPTHDFEHRIGGSSDKRSPFVVALDSVMSRLETVEEQLRKAEVERVAVLADAFDVLAAETGTAYGSIPTGVGGELAYRALRAEIAVVAGVTERTAERQLHHALQLRHNYRRVGEAFDAGDISYRHATVIVDAGAIIGSGDGVDAVARRVGYEEAVLPLAMQQTPNRLQPIARRLAEQFAERSLEERYEEARECRRVWLVEQPDGMADVVAHLPAVEAHGIYDRITRIARGVERAERDAKRARNGDAERSGDAADAEFTGPVLCRTRDQLRADVLAELALQGVPPAEWGCFGTSVGGDECIGADSTSLNSDSITARVQVVIPVKALGPEAQAALTRAGPSGLAGAGAHANTYSGTGSAISSGIELESEDDPPYGAPAFLAGYGPIDDTSARALARGARYWETVSVDEKTGGVLSVDRYRPSEAMRRFLVARDQRCRFVGCSVSASRCDVDHTIDAALGGATATSNLAHLCRGHHTLKHHTGWRVKQLEHGVLEWTTPTGRTRIDRPPGTTPPGATPSTPPHEHPF